MAIFYRCRFAASLGVHSVVTFSLDHLLYQDAVFWPLVCMLLIAGEYFPSRQELGLLGHTAPELPLGIAASPWSSLNDKEGGRGGLQASLYIKKRLRRAELGGNGGGTGRGRSGHDVLRQLQAGSQRFPLPPAQSGQTAKEETTWRENSRGPQ